MERQKKRLALLASFLMDLSHFYVILDYAIALSNTALIKAFVCCNTRLRDCFVQYSFD